MKSTAMEKYFSDTNSYSIVPWQMSMNPVSSWGFPIVTGHKNKVHWGVGLDWTTMEMDISEMWTPNDLDIVLAINFTDVRAEERQHEKCGKYTSRRREPKIGGRLTCSSTSR